MRCNPRQWCAALAKTKKAVTVTDYFSYKVDLEFCLYMKDYDNN